MQKIITRSGGKSLQPMDTRLSLLTFLVPAVVMFVFVYLLMPFLELLGATEFESFIIIFTIAPALLFVAALSLHKRDNGNGGMSGFMARFRLERLRVADFALGVGMFVVMVAGYNLMSTAGRGLINAGLIPVPVSIPGIMNPRVEFSSSILASSVGGNLAGNWTVAWAYSVMLLFNIFGEELFWRGYVLPRQEISFASKTWLVHGLLWTLFHSFKWWDLINLLPVCLILSYVAHKRKSTWPGLIAHLLFNGMALPVVIRAIL